MQACTFLKMPDAKKHSGVFLRTWEGETWCLDAEFYAHVHLRICGYLHFENEKKQAAARIMPRKDFLLFFCLGKIILTFLKP